MSATGRKLQLGFRSASIDPENGRPLASRWTSASWIAAGFAAPQGGSFRPRVAALAGWLTQTRGAPLIEVAPEAVRRRHALRVIGHDFRLQAAIEIEKSLRRLQGSLSGLAKRCRGLVRNAIHALSWLLARGCSTNVRFKTDRVTLFDIPKGHLPRPSNDRPSTFGSERVLQPSVRCRSWMALCNAFGCRRAPGPDCILSLGPDGRR